MPFLTLNIVFNSDWIAQLSRFWFKWGLMKKTVSNYQGHNYLGCLMIIVYFWYNVISFCAYMVVLIGAIDRYQAYLRGRFVELLFCSIILYSLLWNLQVHIVCIFYFFYFFNFATAFVANWFSMLKRSLRVM